jgi:nitrogen regulatory protein PII-like uncharacterized protein
MSKIASAAASGITNPKNYQQFEKSPAVQEALSKLRELAANDIMFDRKEAHRLLMDAHANAATATEQVLAIREMIKLHGVAAPEVKEIRQSVEGKVTHEVVRDMSDDELMLLAKLDDEEVPQVLEGEYELVDKSQSTD